METRGGLQARQFNRVDVEQAKRALPLSLSAHPNPPRYLAACRGNLPGAMPLQGAVGSSTADIDGQLQNAFAMEERDHADLTRGFGMLSDAEQRGVFSRVVELGQEVFVGHHFDSSPVSVDTVMLAMNLFAMYLGRMDVVSFDALPREEKELLPGVCLLSAIKFDEDVRNVLPMLAKVLADGQRPWEQLKRQMASLEWKVLYQTDFRLMTPTPVAFLHLFLGRTVSQGALAQHSTPPCRRGCGDQHHLPECGGGTRRLFLPVRACHGRTPPCGTTRVRRQHRRQRGRGHRERPILPAIHLALSKDNVLGRHDDQLGRRPGVHGKKTSCWGFRHRRHHPVAVRRRARATRGVLSRGTGERFACSSFCFLRYTVCVRTCIRSTAVSPSALKMFAFVPTLVRAHRHVCPCCGLLFYQCTSEENATLPTVVASDVPPMGTYSRVFAVAVIFHWCCCMVTPVPPPAFRPRDIMIPPLGSAGRTPREAHPVSGRTTAKISSGPRQRANIRTSAARPPLRGHRSLAGGGSLRRTTAIQQRPK